MKRAKMLDKMIASGVIAVVRSETEEKAIKIVEALVNGGITGIELTYSVPMANDVIERLVTKYENTNVIIGAGTVLDVSSARLAIIAGAQFIVSPSFNKEVAKLANLYQVPYVPGILTPTEAQNALEYGSELIKLFPGDIAGKAMIKDLKGPFPYINIMPSGGVSAENISGWLSAGAAVVSAGSALIAPAEIDDYDSVTANAKASVRAYKAAF
ncbi:MAG: bifunctional 2-keto-4-hydroxyglutarate aldolase/2-keto-3-deoxy-6-phosphogluconate aldolase [Streptococcaceae bacterium]|nr:bifunctional 2-keto-4-hydroxyglutarate aldolase/2-keto-3-deoxy-6-phosphogluconate aldolase [Streptococcaceae bacterium]